MLLPLLLGIHSPFIVHLFIHSSSNNGTACAATCTRCDDGHECPQLRMVNMSVFDDSWDSVNDTWNSYRMCSFGHCFYTLNVTMDALNRTDFGFGSVYGSLDGSSTTITTSNETDIFFMLWGGYYPIGRLELETWDDPISRSLCMNFIYPTDRACLVAQLRAFSYDAIDMSFSCTYTKACDTAMAITLPNSHLFPARR